MWGPSASLRSSDISNHVEVALSKVFGEMSIWEDKYLGDNLASG